MTLFNTFVLIGSYCATVALYGTVQCQRPIGLSCEFLSHPGVTVIYDPKPEFAWVCGSANEAFLQSAYRVVVCGVSPETDREEHLVWDTGRIYSDQSVNVQYAGAPLEPNAWYEWRVQAWNSDGIASDWSKPQRFRMADHLNEEQTSLYPLSKIPHPAEKVVILENGKYLVDFGKDAFGYLLLKLPESKQANSLEVHFGEKTDQGIIDRQPGGSIRYYLTSLDVPSCTTEIAVHPPSDQRNTSGAAILLPDYIGVIAPFRYVEVFGAPDGLEKEDFIQIRVEYPFDEAASSFKSSNPILNDVWQLCKYSIRATTFCGTYVDGDRERIPYEADAYINQLAHYGVDREYALARHSHEYLLTHPTWPTEWKQHSILLAWADYQYTGNSESLAQNYEVLKHNKLLTSAELPNGLVNTSSDRYQDIVDWPEGERDEYDMRPVNTVVNAFHYATLKRMADVASVVDRAADAEEFKRKANQFKQQFNTVFWNQGSEAYVDGAGSEHTSLHANLFPLAFGLVPEDRIPSVLEFIKSRSMACSVYAAQYLLEGLYKHNEDRYALNLLTSRDKRSWYNMIRSGSTITMEAWDQQFKPNLDWNHAWGAAPAGLIPAYLVGVRPLEPGFKKILIQPRPGEIESFASRVPCIRGPIDVCYSRSDKNCRLEIVIPGNSTADVGVPLLGGMRPEMLVWNGNKVQVLIRGDHAWIENVPPGCHQMEATFLEADTP